MNLEAEQSVIGSVLLDNNCLYQIYNLLTPEMFQSTFCANAYGKMLAMYDRGLKINSVTLVDSLITESVTREIAEQNLIDCVDKTPTSTCVKQYAEAVERDYRSRQFAKIVHEADLQTQNVDDNISKVLVALEELQRKRKSNSKTMAEIIEEYKGNYFNDNNVLKNSVRTGFNKLDDCLGGLQGGDITVIGARPSVGKSAFATQIIANACSKGKKVGYFNLEMVESQVYERLLSRMAELSLVRIRRATTFLGDEQKQFDHGNEILSKYNLVISTGSKSDLDIKAECRHQNFDLIVIDYLQLIRSAKKCESRRVEVGEVSRNLKALAMELNVPIILLSQLSRASEHTDTKEPTMADLRETGDIEQDASNIILLWKLSQNPALNNYKGIKVEKNRQGELIEYAMDFKGENMTFFELDDSLKEIKDAIKELERNGAYQDENPF